MNDEDTMYRRLTILLGVLVLLSFVVLPIGSVQAQTKAADVISKCPPYAPALINDQGYLHSLPRECLKIYRQSDQKNASPTNVSGMNPLTVGGPDGFGYTYNDTVAFSWVAATTNSGLVGDDEFMGPFDIGFEFPFYGIPQSQLYFSTNGVITFDGGNSGWGGSVPVPSDATPNNFIAPYWDDFVVGVTGNTGAIYYKKGGTAPNRYLVMEWRNVELYGGSLPFSFEAILYENGDIVIQHQSLPVAHVWTIGIEDSAGYQGLEYPYYPVVPGSIRFYYPTAPTARLLVKPIEAGQFASLNAPTDVALTVSNVGTRGTDTYDFSIASDWPATLYSLDGTTVLTDTDGDTLIDTGPVAQGTAVIVKARFTTTGGAQVGTYNDASVTVASSLDNSKTQTVNLPMSIPAGFATASVDEDGAMGFLTAHPDGTNIYKATLDNYYGFDVAVTKLATGSYLYAWSNAYDNGTSYVTDIEYAFLDRNGSLILPVTKLTNNSTATNYVHDSAPSIATAPNGTIGLVWTHYIYNASTSLNNSNIYMATITPSGGLLSGPVNLTKNSVWDDGSLLNARAFFEPTIAGSDDNRFMVSWREEKPSTNEDNIWYTVLNTSGGTVFPATGLTNDGMSWAPALNRLSGSKMILTWCTSGSGPYYAVLNGNGSIIKGRTSLGDGDFNWSTDATLLPNGKVAIASVSDAGVQFYVLSSSYNIESGPAVALTQSSELWDGISVTTDASSHIVMTWSSDTKLFYALGDSAGAFVTLPMPYGTNPTNQLNRNGEGSAPYEVGYPVDITVGGALNAYSLVPTESQRLSYKGANAGPVQIAGLKPILASQRVIYGGWSYSEMMGLPFEQLSKEYLFPYYNNVAMDSQLRVSNVGGADTTIKVYLGSSPLPIDSYTLAAGGATRKNYAGRNSGPLRVTSSASDILATIRVLYAGSSYSELMGLPVEQLSKEYLFPYYNNVAMDSQLRVSNVGGADTTITVYLGSDTNPIDSYTLAAGGATRKNYGGKNSGPLRVTSTDSNILTTIRVLYAGNSLSELMGFPVGQLSESYWYPVYDNMTLDSQLRVSNVGSDITTITVYAGTEQIDSYELGKGAASRKNYPRNTGPLHVVSSTQPILTTVRLLYGSSLYEMTGLPNEQLSTQYFFPWYNNYAMNSELRFAVP
jgi:hypothetical protein